MRCINPMYRKSQFYRPSRQRGSMLVTALFVIIVLSLLGLAMTRILSSSADAVTHEIYGIRAMNAAQSGLQRAIANAFPLNGGAVSCASISLNFVGIPGLENCVAQASCSSQNYAAENLDYYRFSSTGTCTIGNVITSRTVAVDGKVQN